MSQTQQQEQEQDSSTSIAIFVQQPDPLVSPPPQQREGGTPRKKRNSQPKSTKEGEEKKKEKGRKFFQQLQPIFAVATSAAKPKLEFLDHSDPGKDAVVRKKAREWVHRNKERAVVPTRGDFVQTPVASNGWINENEVVVAGEKRGGQAGKKEERRNSNQMEKRNTLLIADPLWSAGASRFDPFNQLPKVGRNVDHIIEYFLTSCPEEVPCSDDKFAFKPQMLMIASKRDNTVLANMAGEHVSYVLWLHATTFVRDGVLGRPAAEESLWFYKQSLKVMREALRRDVSEYTDCFLNAFACFTATSNFAGMFDAATMHSNAMVKAIKLRGEGDITKGILSCCSWTKKALQWCEFMVCAQLPQAPQIPYLPPRNANYLPHVVIAEADRLSFITLANIPPISNTLFNIIRWLHQLALAQSKGKGKGPVPQTPSSSISTPDVEPWPSKKTLDACVIRPLYDAEYALLQALAAQKALDGDSEDSSNSSADGNLTETEVLLAESCQLYLWLCPRGLPPEMAMCALFIARMKKAILPVLRLRGAAPLSPTITQSPESNASSMPTPSQQDPTVADLAAADQHAPFTTPPSTSSFSSTSSPTPITPPTQTQETKLDNLLIWSLMLGTLVSRIHARPEHPWFHEQLRLQLKAMGGGWAKRKDILESVWTLFPHMEAAGWRDFKHLGLELEKG